MPNKLYKEDYVQGSDYEGSEKNGVLLNTDGLMEPMKGKQRKFLQMKVMVSSLREHKIT